MEMLKTPKFRICLYDSHLSVKNIAAEKVKGRTDPTREDLDDPFMMLDLGDVVSKDQEWQKLLPTVDAFYAVKCNPDPALLRIFLALGRGFDCASKEEIKMILDLGGSPDRIIFAHPYKQPSHLRFAREKGVRLMTFDTAEELYKVKRYFPEALLVLRILFDDQTSTYQLGAKFGCALEDAITLLKCAKTLDLEVVGVSFHVGSEATNPEVFADAIRQVRRLFDAGVSLGFHMNLVDLGGGFPGKENPVTPFHKFAETIRKALEDNFPPSSGAKFMAEPGTFYTRSAGQMVANVMAKRAYDDRKQDRKVMMYYLNVGIYGGLNFGIFDPTYFGTPEPLTPRILAQSDALKPSCIWGPTCDANDVIHSSCMMPELDEGDFVIFHDTGGYTTVCGSTFNGYNVPPTCYIAPKQSRAFLEQVFSP